ncbi:PREDICTED: mitochondrial carrier homolog 2-like [Priapulus caudatus]|uniref:Mitochondrial carrier homolog 2-like n=1 Tax=Priapulus caudatus TaxID=37621 RepID=A0ABM1EYT3_PRICU|nr:PREDICTED: mitochondrial carrier homolog 2-like [Priapulus caudatus]
MSAPEKKEEVSKDLFKHVLFGVGVTAAAYPLTYAKVLVQIGHEPIAPKLTTTWLGRKTLVLPNVFKYVGHIWNEDGFFGIYRGLTFKLATAAVASATAHSVLENLQQQQKKKKSVYEDIGSSDNPSVKAFVIETSNHVISQTAAIIVSQPLHVMTIRSMAQFVGGEQHYSGFFSSFVDIWREEGILGFFSGMMPRLFGELLIILVANSVTFVVNSWVFTEMDVRHYCAPIANILAGTVMYPFNVVSTVMAVNSSGLVAGSPPAMPHYTGWIDCWKQLSREHALKRGSSMMVRYYTGPVIQRDNSSVPVKKGNPVT